MKPEPLTYLQMMEDQTSLVTVGRLNQQTAANRATALRLFLRANNVQMEDVVGMEMRPHFPLAIERMVTLLRAEGRSDRSISNTRSALTSWKQTVTEYDTARALQQSQPTPFADLLKTTVDKHPVAVVARQCGVPASMLFGWLGGKMPRPSNAKYIRRIEGFFGLERESLVALAGIVDCARAREQVGTPQTIEYRQKLGARTASPYCLVPPEVSPLRQQWMALARYKTAPAPNGLERSGQGRWTFSRLDVIKESKANWATFLDGVEVPTAKATWAHTSAYLGWMALSRDQGGLGMPKETLQTLAWLVVPDFVEKYLEWQKKRCGGKRTKSMSELLHLITCLVRPVVGYLYQQPEFLKTLPEGFQKEDWYALCQRQFNYITKLQSAFEPEMVQSRDPFEPIRNIIELPQPLEAIADMVQRMRRDRPIGGNATSEAIWARDIVMVKLCVSNPLRLRNLAALTWSPTNVDSRKPHDRGCLYQRGDGSWWLFVPKGLLKNRKGDATDDYHSPVHASVWGDLERYLLRHRADLVQWPTDLVFIARKQKAGRVESIRNGPYKRPVPTGHGPFMEMSKRFVELTRKYLWKSDGIGLHAVRHLVATGILKTDSGDIKTAALVLHDTEATVAKAYSGMSSGDGAIRMGKLLGTTLNRM